MACCAMAVLSRYKSLIVKMSVVECGLADESFVEIGAGQDGHAPRVALNRE